MNDDLIKRSDAIKTLKNYFQLLARPRAQAIKAIKSVPSVNIIHCQECKYCSYRVDYKKDYCTQLTRILFSRNGFCSWGERTTSDEIQD